MSTTKNILMQEFNGTDYDFLFPETDAYTKEETLNNMVKKYLKLDDVSTPSDAFLKLIFGVDAKLYQVKVIFPDGTPVSNIDIGGLTAPSGFNMKTDDNGQVIRKNTSVNPTITAYTRFLDYKTTQTVAQTVDNGITNVVITLEEQPLNEVLYLDSSISNCSVRRDAIKYIDWTVQGGGESGGAITTQGERMQSKGGKGGKTGHALNVAIPLQNTINVIVPSSGNREVINTITINGTSYPQNEAPLDDNSKNNYNYIFNEQLLGLAGGGDGGSGGSGRAYKEPSGAWAWNMDFDFSGGAPNGGAGGRIVYYSEENRYGWVQRRGGGKVPRGGGGGAAYMHISRLNATQTNAGARAARRVYYRLKTSL